MQVTETLNAGLKREIKVTVPAQDIEAKLMARLTDAKSKVRINGFRPGKVPVQHLRKMYGKSFMAEVVNEILSTSTRDILSDRGEKAAMQPEVMMTEDEKEAEKILAGGSRFRIQPELRGDPGDRHQGFLRHQADPARSTTCRRPISRSSSRSSAEWRATTPRRMARPPTGDKVTIDYVGKVDGEPFEGGSGTRTPLVLGSGQFIPGFEEQLVGAKAGDEKTVTVTFPENYQAAHLAGKRSGLRCQRQGGRPARRAEVDDEMATKLGLESLERLREVVRGQIENQFGQMTRQKVKRALLDQLDSAYRFEAPSKLVEAEFNNIWTQVNRDLEAAGRTFADEDTTEEEARADYQRLAERRVRLGLVLAEIGEKAGVQVSDDEMQRSLFETIRRFPANQQQEIYEFYRTNPAALTNIRAPLFEEKVVDHLLAQVSVTDQKVSRDELLADEDAETAAKPQKTAKDKAAAKSAAGEGGEAGQEAAAPKKPAARKKAAKAGDAAAAEPSAGAGEAADTGGAAKGEA